ncbi:hypothetical protein SOASR030_09390 [Leminorella grimontii]|uniref:Uncharacterized protein n=1 Tax=Leminorella grimontii TaxID=82981 RepID=A0AAV5N308_9GAMM|nr:hypothetical protein SOASR030_09390 [Leminorella grimontii]GKX58245.1 hypothetical protein SOASR031_05600 [Leminorella grimontii]
MINDIAITLPYEVERHKPDAVYHYCMILCARMPKEKVNSGYTGAVWGELTESSGAVLTEGRKMDNKKPDKHETY